MKKRINAITNRFTTKLISDSLALGYPFVQNQFLDDHGIYLGNSLDGDPIIVDFFKKDDYRNSHNSCTFGMNGKGKTVCFSKLIMHKAMQINNKVIIIDPKRDYYKLVTNMKGTYIDISGSSTECACLNPFEVFLKKYEDGSNPLVMHFIFLADFFKILFPQLNGTQEALLNRSIRKAYEAKKINEASNFEKIKPHEYPIVEDLHKFLTNFKCKDDDENSDRRVLISYLSNFITDGNFQTIWNRHTNIDLSDQKLICFDIQKLINSTSGGNNITNAQLFLVLKWIYAQVIENKDKNDKLANKADYTWIDIFVDEGHALTTHSNRTPLHFLFTMFKTIRGYSGGIHFITQNISNLASNTDGTKEYTTSMLDNSQYLFIFGLQANDINDLNKLLNEIGGLTEYEKDFLNTAKIGECIFAPSQRNRIKLAVNLSSLEQDLFTSIIDPVKLDQYYPEDTDAQEE